MTRMMLVVLAILLTQSVPPDRASDAAPIAIIELVDRDVEAKGQDSGPVLNEDEYEAA